MALCLSEAGRTIRVPRNIILYGPIVSSSLTLSNGLTVSMCQRFSFNATLRPFISLSSVDALMTSSMDIALGTAFTARK